MTSVVSVVPTIATSAYTAGDAVGDVMTFDTGTRLSRNMLIDQILLFDEDTQDEEYNLVLFSDATSGVADDAAFTVTKANRQAGKVLGIVNIASSDYEDTIGGGSVAKKTKLGLILPIVLGKIYAQLVAVATPDYTAADSLTVQMHISEYD